VFHLDCCGMAVDCGAHTHVLPDSKKKGAGGGNTLEAEDIEFFYLPARDAFVCIAAAGS